MKMIKNTISAFAKKSFLAFKDPYHSVEKVYPNIIDEVNEEAYYTGVKNVPQIPTSLLHQLKRDGNYLLHTLDAHAIGGRAVDMQRKNPISSRPMTGSSSGTAINVLLGINDLGIGTDGGGSVLAPAMALNLYGFISKLICENELTKYAKKSTDNITFTPAIGYMTRTFGEINRVINVTLDLPEVEDDAPEIGFLNRETGEMITNLTNKKFKSIVLECPDILGPRNPLIEFLNNQLPDVDFIVSEEGPIDFYGLGDSVLGHFDELTQEVQRKGNKGLIRVANMANATAITIPKQDFASAYVLICESKVEKIAKMFDFAEKLQVPEDELVQRYFRNVDSHYEESFGGM